MKVHRILTVTTVLAMILLVGTAGPLIAADTGAGSFKQDTGIELSFGVPVDEAWAKIQGAPEPTKRKRGKR